MKKIIFTIAIILTGLVLIYGISIQVKKTASTTFRKQPVPQEAHYFLDDLLDAIEWVESKGLETALGDDGELGAYQLKKIYVEDYYRITQKRPMTYFETNDIRLDAYWSRQITNTVTRHYAHLVWKDKPWDKMGYFETCVRIHNGGPTGYKKESTKVYWDKVKARMYRAD